MKIIFLDQSNSSIEKAGILGAMKTRLLPVDDDCSLRGVTLMNAMNKDVNDGLIPCFVVATLGTTPTCAFDNLNEIGPVCKNFDVWLHIDAAYAGTNSRDFFLHFSKNLSFFRVCICVSGISLLDVWCPVCRFIQFQSSQVDAR